MEAIDHEISQLEVTVNTAIATMGIAASFVKDHKAHPAAKRFAEQAIGKLTHMRLLFEEAVK